MRAHRLAPTQNRGIEFEGRRADLAGTFISLFIHCGRISSWPRNEIDFDNRLGFAVPLFIPFARERLTADETCAGSSKDLAYYCSAPPSLAAAFSFF
jgi:hypothetical protein